MGPVIIEKTQVQMIRWDVDPDSYDQRLHTLGKDYDEFVIVNPIYDN